MLAGCAGTLPPHGERPVSVARAAPAGTPIADIAARIGLAEGATAAWPMPEAEFALDARIAAIERATSSLDAQTYLLADDPTGRGVLRALRDAAARGVRVRLLLDDIGTAGLDGLLMGLAAEPNAEVRLFNPFVAGRAWTFGRLLAFAGDFDRLDHRMHNKLFIADGALAIVAAATSPTPTSCAARKTTSSTWNSGSSARSFPRSAAPSTATGTASTRTTCGRSRRRRGPSMPTSARCVSRSSAERPSMRPHSGPTGVDLFGAAALSEAFASGRFGFLPVAAASTYADPPEKVNGSAHGPSIVETVADLLLAGLDEARDEVVLFSPYFIPGPELMARLRKLRERSVSVRVITNSLAVSDEPMTSIALERHQRELLAMGVELYELSSERIRHDSHLSVLVGASIGRLHAKMVLVDRRTVYIGSLNLDGRSAHINTEIGVRLESAEIASMLFRAFRVEEAAGVYRVRLGVDGRTLVWSILNGSGQEETLEDEPDASWWRRLRLRLLSIFVPEGQL